MHPFNKIILSVLLTVVAFNVHAFSPCRIQGYPYAIECKKILIASPISHQLIWDVTVYKVAARVRYPKPSPLFWLPDNIGVNPSNRAPTIIQSLSRIRNTRDLYWIAFLPNSTKMRGDCAWPHPIPSVRFRLDRFADPNYLAACQHQLQHLSTLSEMTPDTLAYYYETVANNLGVQRVTVFAERAGAEVADAWHQRSPKRILFQVLDNPEDAYQRTHLSAQITAFILQLQTISNRCVTSGQCNGDYLGLDRQLSQLIKQLPFKLNVRNPYTLSYEEIDFSESFIAASWLQLLQSPEQAQWLPSLIQRAQQGDWMPMYQQYVKYWGRSQPDIQYAVLLAQQCIGWSQLQDARQKIFAKPSKAFETLPEKIIFDWMYQQLTQRYRKLCSETPSLMQQVVRKAIAPPAQLILSGQHPLSQQTTSNHEHTLHLALDGVGSSALGYGCAKEVIARYVKYQDQHLNEVPNQPLEPATIEAECLLRIPPPLKPNVQRMQGQAKHD